MLQNMIYMMRKLTDWFETPSCHSLPIQLWTIFYPAEKGDGGVFAEKLTGLVVNTEMHCPNPPSRKTKQLGGVLSTLSGVWLSCSESPGSRSCPSWGSPYPLINGDGIIELAISTQYGTQMEQFSLQSIWPGFPCPSLTSSFCPILFPVTGWVLGKHLSSQCYRNFFCQGSSMPQGIKT